MNIYTVSFFGQSPSGDGRLALVDCVRLIIFSAFKVNDKRGHYFTMQTD